MDHLYIRLIILHLSIVAEKNNLLQRSHNYGVLELLTAKSPLLLMLYYMNWLTHDCWTRRGGVRCDTAFIEPMHRNKPNITYLLEEEGGSLIAAMALAHPLHPIDNRPRNRRRNLWVGWCVSSWWPDLLTRRGGWEFDRCHGAGTSSPSHWQQAEEQAPKHVGWMMCDLLMTFAPVQKLGVNICICIFYMSSFIGLYTYNRSVIQYWWSCTLSHSIGLYFWGGAVPGLNATFCFLWFTNCVLLSDDDRFIPGCLWLLAFILNNTLILGIWCFTIPHLPGCFALNLLSEYWIQHGAIGPLYVTSSYSTWIYCRGVSGFATDWPCDVWCRGLTTCLLHVGPPFRNRFLNNSWAVGLI